MQKNKFDMETYRMKERARVIDLVDRQRRETPKARRQHIFGILLMILTLIMSFFLLRSF